MKKNVRRIALLLTFALLSGCLAGCAHGPAPRPETPPASGQTDDDYPPQEDQTQDPYGDYVLSDAVEPGKYPPPTDAVVAEAEAWLTTQEGIVQAFWEKNNAVLENAAGKLFAISGQYPDRKYYYEIADRNLVTSLFLTEDDPEEAALRAELTEALNQVSALPGTGAFERVLINDWELTVPVCAFSGAIKVFDGIGCYVSLVYLPDGTPGKTPDTLKMLDEHWALLTMKRSRNDIGETVPSDKKAEVYCVQTAKQSWEEYRFLLDNRELMEQVISEMLFMAKTEPGYHFSYVFKKTAFHIQEGNKGPYEGEGASADLLEKLGALSDTPGIDTFSYVSASLHEDDPANDYDEEKLSCVFCGETLCFDGSGYWYDLNYTPDEAPEKLPYSECIKLDEHWYLSSDHYGG